jgi:AraC-like DNA-binding protein
MATQSKLESLDVVLNSAAVFHCAENWRIGPDWAGRLTDYDLWCVWGGLGQMTTSDGEIDLHPGRCVWMRPGRHYEATHDPKKPLRVTFIHFHLKDKNRLLSPAKFVPPVEVFEPHDPAYFESATRHIIDLYSRSGLPHAAAHLLKSLLLEIVVRKSGGRPESSMEKHHRMMISPVITLVRNQPEQRFTVTELAAQAGYSVDHFVRLFHAMTGQSPKEFMIRQRIERAMLLLRESSQTVTQISDSLGYEDLGFFSRQFKEHVGVSPDRFRQRGVVR